jgi:hypothetical protein
VFKSRENQYRLSYVKPVLLKDVANIVASTKDEKKERNENCSGLQDSVVK